MTQQQPFRCFDLGYLAKLGSAAVVMIALAIASKAFERGTTARIALVGLETIVMAYIIVTTVRSISRLDEMNLRIHFEAITLSFTVTAVLGSGLAMLERAGLPIGGWEKWLWAQMVFVWGIGVLIIRRRYR